MFGWAVFYLLAAMVAAVFAYGIIVPSATYLAHACVFLFSVLSMMSLANGLSRPPRRPRTR